MSEKTPLKLKPLVSAVGATFAVTLSSTPLVRAEDNPFSLTELTSGYMFAQESTATPSPAQENPSQKPAEGKCGEGKCGANMNMDQQPSTPDTRATPENTNEKPAEGKCGEGKCGVNMNMSQINAQTPPSEGKGSEGMCAGMVMDMKGMIMNENKDRLPGDCKEISEEAKITVHGGRKFARKFNGAAFAFDQQEWDVKPCTKVTVTFVNDDHVRHQFMIHGLPAYLYPAGMFHMEVNGPGEKTATFIVPSAKKTYLVHCDIAQHMEKGMKAQLKVAGGDGDLPSIPGLTGPRFPQWYPEAYPKGGPSPYSSSDPSLFRGSQKEEGDSGQQP